MKKTSFDALAVLNHLDSGNSSCALPEVGYFPIIGNALGFDEEDMGSQASLAMRHDRGQFTNTRSSTGTVRMRQDD